MWASGTSLTSCPPSWARLDLDPHASHALDHVEHRRLVDAAVGERSVRPPCPERRPVVSRCPRNLTREVEQVRCPRLADTVQHDGCVVLEVDARGVDLERDCASRRHHPASNCATRAVTRPPSRRGEQQARLELEGLAEHAQAMPVQLEAELPQVAGGGPQVARGADDGRATLAPAARRCALPTGGARGPPPVTTGSVAGSLEPLSARWLASHCCSASRAPPTSIGRRFATLNLLREPLCGLHVAPDALFALFSLAHGLLLRASPWRRVVRVQYTKRARTGGQGRSLVLWHMPLIGFPHARPLAIALPS